MKRYEVRKDTVDMFLKSYYTWRNEPGDDELGEPFENKELFDKLSKIFSVKVKYIKGGAFIEYPNAYVKFLKMDYYDRKTSFKYKFRQWVYDKGIFKSGQYLFKILDFTNYPKMYQKMCAKFQQIGLLEEDYNFIFNKAKEKNNWVSNYQYDLETLYRTILGKNDIFTENTTIWFYIKNIIKYIFIA